jgi:DNA phosphorothioation-dependent restriction protein DptF
MEQIVTLKEALSTLKESSMAAIADADCGSFDEIKRYLHLERDIEVKLRTFLERLKESNCKKLLLVCGNVGDGKSHLLASIRINFPELLADVKLHNDATESSDPNATFIDELNIIFSPFSDQNVDIGNEKVVIAINLGTLNNFLASDTDNRFSKLKEYVKDQNILELGDIVECKFDEDSQFQFVNFCDYHLFYLTKDGPESELIETAMERVTSSDGPFFKAYENQKVCFPDNCPICFNFEILQSPQIRKKISALLIKCIIQGEIIISIRALYNFIYELIVPIELESLAAESTSTTISNFSQVDFLRNIIPNYIFSHPELSYIFREIQKHDPAIRRGEIIDDAIIDLMVSDTPLRIMEKYIPLDDMNINLTNIFQKNTSTDEDINTFIRTAFFWPKTDFNLLNNQSYETYMSLMFEWYSGTAKSLKTLYILVQNAVASWRGQVESGEINIDIGRQQLKYRTSQNIEFKPDPPSPLASGKEKIKIFNLFLPIRYKVDGNTITVAITYNLFYLMNKIREGYRPTDLDHSNFIVFDEFAQGIESAGGGLKQVFFTESANRHRFVLELDGFGDFCFSEVTE